MAKKNEANNDEVKKTDSEEQQKLNPQNPDEHKEQETSQTEREKQEQEAKKAEEKAKLEAEPKEAEVPPDMVKYWEQEGWKVK